VEFYSIYVPVNTRAKMALAAYCAENDSIQQLSTYQLGLVKKCVDILSPIEEATHSISARLASITIVIPYVRVLIRTLEKMMKTVVYIP